MATEPPGRLVGNRGFTRFERLTARGGDTIEVSESSLATGPHVWLMINEVRIGQVTMAQLPLDVATTLRDQLTWLIENHYQVRSDG